MKGKRRSSEEKKNKIFPAILLNPRDFPFQNLKKKKTMKLSKGKLGADI